MKVNKATLKKIIKEAVENAVNSPFAKIQEMVANIQAETSNQIEMLTNKNEQLNNIVPLLERIQEDINEYYPGTTVINGRYEDNFIFKFANPIVSQDDYQEENRAYDLAEYLEKVVKDTIYNQAITVDTEFGEKDEIIGFSVSIDLDRCQGWY